MTNEKRNDYHQPTIDAVANQIELLMVHLHEHYGLPWDLIAIGAHAQAVAAMTTIIGGPMAAQCCERAADRVRDLPSAAATSLAFMAPEGRA